MSNSLDPDQAQQNVGPDLGPNCLQKLSAIDTSRHIVNLRETDNAIKVIDITMLLKKSLNINNEEKMNMFTANEMQKLQRK